MSAMIGNPLLLPTEGYEISRSVRLRSSASAYFNRTPGSATNRQTWTWSGWCKVGTISVARALFSAGADGSNYTSIDWRADNRIQLYSNTAGSIVGSIVWDPMVFRDPSAWYHIVIVCDTTNATQTSRFRFYVNGVQFTTISGTGGENNWPAQNANTNINNTVAHSLGRKQHGANEYFDGYLTENNFIDGQALTPSSFGETDAITGVWKPKKYTGTYGTNGFFLNFSDNSAATAAAIGKDYSGNGNNWTPNNISVTAGSTYDSMLDVPTLWADGGNGRGNYCTLNPLLQRWSQPNSVFSNGNLKVTTSSANSAYSLGTIYQSSGKYYWEVTVVAAGNTAIGIGVGDSLVQYTTLTNTAQYLSSGSKTVGGSSSAYGASYTTNDVIGVALDLTGGTVTFYKNNTSQGSISLPSTTDITAFQDINTPADLAINFGQRPFSYTPPTGFVALNTQNLPAPTISNGASYMAATTYTGTGSALTIANTVGSASFQPDLVWVKGRSGATDHAWYDAVRGVQKQLESNTTTAETTETTGLTAFGSTGFTIGALAQMNTSAATYVAWAWNAGGSTVTNTSGSISAQVRANATAGFSVVTYTGAGGNSTVGHGLGVAPRMIIVKSRSTAGTAWPVYHASLGNTQVITLNTTSATATVGVWGNTTPTSSVFTVSDAGATNGDTNFSTRTYVAYCFAQVAGYSAFGSYTGNGNVDGPFVYLGFRPRFVLLKPSSAVQDWMIVDTSRSDYNVTKAVLAPNSSQAESAFASGYDLDILSNGFKMRNSAYNANGATIIYAAFAENPFKLSLAR